VVTDEGAPEKPLVDEVIEEIRREFVSELAKVNRGQNRDISDALEDG